MHIKRSSLWIGFTVLLLLTMGASECAPKAKAPPPEAAESAVSAVSPNLSMLVNPVSSPIATLYIPPYLVRYRIRYIPPGWFPLGSDEEDDKRARGDETPVRHVVQSGFWMGESEVSNKEYMDCVKSGCCTPPSLRETGPTNHYGDPAYDDHPVVGVSWFQAAQYCECMDGRLPTEAEWELAAGGEDGYTYPWGEDDPTCDRTNMNGCEPDDSTKPVGSYPLGISPVGLYDMAGNVREWTADSYDPDAYQTAALFEPSNEEEEEKKVARGGGFNDFEENLRTNVRLALDPKQDYDDVGFRCVPITRSYAPICQPNYTRFCYDPDNPPDDEPCVPGQGVPGEEGLTFLGYGCPMNRVVNFQVNTNGGGNSGFTAVVDGVAFDCQPSSAGADVVNCIGPETPMGTEVQIVVCSGGAAPTAEQDGEPVSQASSILPVLFTTSGRVSLMAATSGNCPEGYVFNSDTGACERDPNQPECPEGWSLNRQTQQCEPNDPEEDCPENTTFSANLQGCQPDEDECPEGYYLTAQQTCEPDQNRQDDCPPGYYYNWQIGCCEPIPPDNYGCPDYYYYNARYQRCVPLDDNNCPYGMTYNGYGQCDQDPDMPTPDDEPQGDCPPGLVTAAANVCDQPEEGGDENNPPPGTLLRSGDELTGAGEINTGEDGQGECPEGYVYMASFGRCMQRDENGCPPGYYYEAELRRCRPTNGPNSPCPQGYIYSYRANCCVPQPGMDSTYCPEDGDTDQGTPAQTDNQTPAGTNAAGAPGGVTPFANSNFDILTGLCIEGGTPDDDDNPENPCPPGTYSANFTNCDQYPQDGQQTPDGEEDPEDLKLRMADCPPEYWNANTNTCDYPEPECDENEYFDRELGFCVPLQEDCCELWQDYSVLLKECMDIGTKPRDGECPEGYELLQDGICWLIGRTEGAGQCWTFSINTPRCVGPCEIGLIYNANTGQCEEPVDPCEDVVCSRYNQKTCPSNCCRWVQSETGGGVCKSK